MPSPHVPDAAPPPSPLVMCDRLISLAQEADRAGYAATASHLVHLAHAVFDEGAIGRMPPAWQGRTWHGRA